MKKGTVFVVLLLVVFVFIQLGKEAADVAKPMSPQFMEDLLAESGESGSVESEYQPQTSRRTRMEDLNPKTHRWHLGVCCSTAFSSEWLQQWIELQLIAGVGHIWMIDDSEPGTDPKTAEVIAHYEQLGFVTAYNKRLPHYLPGCEDWKDCIAPKLCHALTHQYVDQFIFADTDEFIYPTMGCDLTDHVKENCDPNVAHHAIRWERFGTSGHYDMPQGLMVENFLSSGGDCTAHPKQYMDCGFKQKLWDFCAECRHVKSMYNTRCVGSEHVGHPHIAANTTMYKLTPERWIKGGVVEERPGSHWREPSCFERPWVRDMRTCRMYVLRGNGALFPPKASRDCCVAGIGYNHYGSKAKKHWDIKLRVNTSRGEKPVFGKVDLNDTISSNVLRFVRALRQRWAQLGLEVSPNVRFYDNKATGQSTFVEKGWRYTEARDKGTRGEILKNVNNVWGCVDACWEADASPPAPSRCGGWTYSKKDRQCTLIHSPFNSWRGGIDLGLLRWPHTAFSANRVMDPGYISGIPLHEGECPLPERLRG